MSACWGWDVSALGADVSTLGIGAAASVNFTLGDCEDVVGLCTLGGGGVGGMRALRFFPRSLTFGLGRGVTVFNW